MNSTAFLLFAGAVAVFIAFSFLALNYLPRPDWFWFLVSFVGLFWMCDSAEWPSGERRSGSASRLRHQLRKKPRAIKLLVDEKTRFPPHHGRLTNSMTSVSS